MVRVQFWIMDNSKSPWRHKGQRYPISKIALFSISQRLCIVGWRLVAAAISTGPSDG